MFLFSTPAGATPIPDTPKTTVTGDETVSPWDGEMMYTFAFSDDGLAANALVALTNIDALMNKPAEAIFAIFILDP